MHTGCDELAVATDRQRHEDQEYSSPPAHCKCNDPGISVFLYLCICVFLILAMIQARPKHFLVETEDKNVADNAVDSNAVEPPVESGETVSGRRFCDWWCRFRANTRRRFDSKGLRSA